MNYIALTAEAAKTIRYYKKGILSHYRFGQLQLLRNDISMGKGQMAK